MTPELLAELKDGLRRDQRIMAGYTPSAEPPESKWALAGQRLADYRRARGMSQRELGERAGYARDTIARYERGRVGSGRPAPKSQARIDIAQALGVDVKDIWW